MDGDMMTKRIQTALAEATNNREQAMAQANYWKGREDALMALLETPKQEPLPIPKSEE